MKVGPVLTTCLHLFKRAFPFVMTYPLGDLKLLFLILKHFLCGCGVHLWMSVPVCMGVHMYMW